MAFYDVVKSLCEKKGISVRKLERDLGAGNGSISYTRKGGMPSAERIQQIAGYFHVPVDYLLTGIMPDGPSHYYSAETHDLINFLFENPKYNEVVDAVKEVKPEDIDFVLRMIKGLNKTIKSDV